MRDEVRKRFFCVCLFVSSDRSACFLTCVSAHAGKAGDLFCVLLTIAQYASDFPVPVDFLTLVLLSLFFLFLFDLHAFIGYLLINFYRILKANAIRSLL